SGRSAVSGALLLRNSSRSWGSLLVSPDSLTSSPCWSAGVASQSCAIAVTGQFCRLGSLVSPDTVEAIVGADAPPAAVHAVPCDGLVQVAVAGSRFWARASASWVPEPPPVLRLNQAHIFRWASVTVTPVGRVLDSAGKLTTARVVP